MSFLRRCDAARTCCRTSVLHLLLCTTNPFSFLSARDDARSCCARGQSQPTMPNYYVPLNKSQFFCFCLPRAHVLGVLVTSLLPLPCLRARDNFTNFLRLCDAARSSRALLLHSFFLYTQHIFAHFRIHTIHFAFLHSCTFFRLCDAARSSRACVWGRTRDFFTISACVRVTTLLLFSPVRALLRAPRAHCSYIL